MIKRKTEQSAPLNAHVTSPAEWVHVDYLKPNPRNPRKHGQEVLRLARTILRTTWGAPILAQRSTHRIIGGHGRLEAAREILAGIEVDGELRGGHEHVFAQGAPGPGFVPVRWLDVSDAEADAMTLADNARGLQGEDDAVLIAEMAAQFGRESEMMRDVGFDAATLDAMIERTASDALSGAPVSIEDAFGALPDGDRPAMRTMSFTLHESQIEMIERAIDAAKSGADFSGMPNENSNGNALFVIAESYLG